MGLTGDESPEALRAAAILERIDSPEKAAALKGAERKEYLKALDETFGARDKRAQEMGFDLGQTWFHGSFKDIEKFSLAKADPEAHFGKAVYLTDSADDASRNYANAKGPDISNRIKLDKERFHNDLLHEGKTGVAVKAEKKSKTKHLGSPGREDGAVYPLVTRTKKVADLTDDGRDWIDFSGKWSKDKTEYIPGKNFEKLQKVLKSLGKKYQFNADQVMTDIGDELYDAVDAQMLAKKLRESEGLIYAENEKGRLVINDVIKEVFKSLGFHGTKIDASDTFKMEIEPGTKHLMAFKPNQIRSIHAAFDPRFKNSGNLLAGVAGGLSTLELLKLLREQEIE